MQPVCLTYVIYQIPISQKTLYIKFVKSFLCQQRMLFYHNSAVAVESWSCRQQRQDHDFSVSIYYALVRFSVSRCYAV